MMLVDYPRLEYISTFGIPWQAGIGRLQGSLIFSEGCSLNDLFNFRINYLNYLNTHNYNTNYLINKRRTWYNAHPKKHT